MKFLVDLRADTLVWLPNYFWRVLVLGGLIDRGCLIEIGQPESRHLFSALAGGESQVTAPELVFSGLCGDEGGHLELPGLPPREDNQI